MTGTTTQNGQIPTDPTQLAGLLLLAVAVTSQLTPEQADALIQMCGLAATVVPFLPRGGR
jgi:hypothetical protein